jgi:poly(3-hydroxybutyrate) depolymerase
MQSHLVSCARKPPAHAISLQGTTPRFTTGLRAPYQTEAPVNLKGYEMMQKLTLASVLVLAGSYSVAANAAGDQRLRTWLEKQEDTASQQTVSASKGLNVRGNGTSIEEKLGDRSLIVYVPKSATKGKTPLLVVLHGGMGNAGQIQSYIGLEPYADNHGFIIAYLNGSPAGRMLSDKHGAWNAGECCGLPQKRNVDDVGFIDSAVQFLTQKYNADANRVFGVGHSNGGMMTYRMLCQSNVYNGAVVYAAVLATNVESCPSARGKRILAIHGAKDDNIPIEGGNPRKGFNKDTIYYSQDHTTKVFKGSGADYTHQVLPNAEHKPDTINDDLQAAEGVSLPQKIVIFLKLNQ